MIQGNDMSQKWKDQLRLLLFVATLVLTASGYAQEQAYTTKSAHLRAGPAREYPVVAIVSPGVQVTVGGCVSDYNWCEVILADSNRGWDVRRKS